MGRLREIGPVLLVLAVLAGTGAAAVPAIAEPPTTETVFRRAELVRNPSLGTALDLDLSVVSRATGGMLRRARYTMLTHRLDRTLLLMPTDDPAAPGALLIADDTYWLLLPQAEGPVELALRHVVAGDLSHAGFLRVNLRLRYEPQLDGEETLGDVPCWRLELKPGSGADPGAIPFGRVRYWVAQEGYLPIRIEFYDHGGDLLKTVRFTRYQDTGMGRRPERIEIEDARRPDELAILLLGQPRGVPTSRLQFDVEDLVALRRLAGKLGAEGRGGTTGGRLVQLLAAAARDRTD